MEMVCREAAYPATGDRKVKGVGNADQTRCAAFPGPVEVASAGQPAGGRGGDGG
jgi:hypothetical protein